MSSAMTTTPNNRLNTMRNLKGSHNAVQNEVDNLNEVMLQAQRKLDLMNASRRKSKL